MISVTIWGVRAYGSEFTTVSTIPLTLCPIVHTVTVNITMQGQSLLQTSFEPTEVMSTYLLAFIVCDFGFISSPPGDAVQVNLLY